MFSKFFSLSFPLDSACGLCHGAAAPEAAHRCTSQPTTATFRSLERLIEAKAAVDAEGKDGRGLGRRIWGWDLYVRKWMTC